MKLLIFDCVGGVKSQQQGMENLVTGYKIHFCRFGRERDFRSLYFFSKENVITARAETQILIDLY